MKKALNYTLFFLIILSGTVSFSQDYRISHREFGHATAKPKYEFSIKYPEIKGFTGNVTAMEMFNKHMNNIVHAASDTFSTWMSQWDTTATNHEMGSYYQASDSVFYASNELISIQLYEGYYFSGAAHPNNRSYAVNYNLLHYREFGLDDILITPWVYTISEICIRELKKQKSIQGEVLNEWIESGAGPNPQNFEVFNVTAEGLVITFITYQVGSYAEGPSEVFIPYPEIKHIVKPDGLIERFVR